MPAAEPTPRPIRFFHRGAIVEVNGAAPTRTVLDWLREDARCTGTKEGCNEGDCGACTVVVAELAEPGDAAAVRGLVLRPQNACLRFLPTLDGTALITVEDLQPMAAGALHPVQQAMVDCHASQCGFCTPGFVMTLWQLYEAHAARSTRPTRPQLADALSGNLCRCTGYRPILDAGERMHALPAVAFDTAPAVEALTTLRARRRSDAAGAVTSDTPAGDGPAGYRAPTTLAQLAALRLADPAATLVAGATDIGLWVNKQFRPLGDIVWLGGVAELRRIETRAAADGAPAHLRIGAGASLEDAWAALVRLHPALDELRLRFASPPIRHAGTMGGNVANGSPIGDSAPVLMALDAQLDLRRGDRTRRVPLDGFYTGYLRNALEPGEFIEAIVVPLPAAPPLLLRAYKIAKRFDSDISAVCAALAMRLDADGIARTPRFAFGGMAATVMRAAEAEAAVADRAWTQATADAAAVALARDFTPLDDHRASAAYRLRVAQNLLRRYWLETRADGPLPPAATRVWPVRAIGVDAT